MTDTSLLPVEEQETEAKHSLLIFWLRMIGWLASGVAAPISTFAIKFGLFTSYGYEVKTDELGNVLETHIALNGWGILSAVLVGFTIISILNEIVDAYTAKYSLAKQTLVGIKNKIVPLAIAIVICYFLKGCIDQIIFCLTTIGICQIAAIPLNPLPEWKAKVKKEEDYSLNFQQNLYKFTKINDYLKTKKRCYYII